MHFIVFKKCNLSTAATQKLLKLFLGGSQMQEQVGIIRGEWFGSAVRDGSIMGGR